MRSDRPPRYNDAARADISARLRRTSLPEAEAEDHAVT